MYDGGTGRPIERRTNVRGATPKCAFSGVCFANKKPHSEYSDQTARQARLTASTTSGNGLGMVWEWSGSVWEWSGSGLGVVWEWSGRGLGVVWEWSGNGLGMVWEWSGNGLGMVWEWSGSGL